MKWHRAETLDARESGRFFIYRYSEPRYTGLYTSDPYYVEPPLATCVYWQLHVDGVCVEEFKRLRDAKEAAEGLVE